MFNLSVDTEKRFNQLERIIEKGMNHFVEVGTALTIIRDEKLYKLLFSTFEEYSKERWGFERRYAYRLIDAAKVNQNVSNWTQTPPTHESQTRPIAHLESDQQKQAWKKAVDTAPNGKVTAKHVEAVVNEMIEPKPKTETVSDLEEDNEPIEDSPALKSLKLYWRAADNREKEVFLEWIKFN